MIYSTKAIHFKRTILFLLGLFSVFPWSNSLLASNEGEPIEISVVSQDQQNPHVVMLNDKNKWFVVWEDWRESYASVYGQFVNADGTMCGSEFRIYANTGSHQTKPRAAYSEDYQQVVVVWESSEGDETGGYVQARAIDLDDLASDSCGGFSLKRSVLDLNFYSDPEIDAKLQSRSSPKIVYNQSDRNFYVAWTEFRDKGKQFTDPWYAYTEYYGDGSFAGYTILAYSSNDYGLEYVQDASTVAGEHLYDLAGDGYVVDDRITIGRLFTSDEVIDKDYFMIEYFDGVENVDLAASPTSGEIIIVWSGVRQIVHDNEDGIIYEHRYDKRINALSFASLHTQIPTTVVSENAAPDGSTQHEDVGINAHNPSIGIDKVTGHFLVAWEQPESIETYNYTKIFAQILFAGASRYKHNFVLASEEEQGWYDFDNVNQSFPFVGYDPTNQRFFVTWTDSRNTALSDENLEVYGQYVDTEGSLRGFNYQITALPDGTPAPGNQFSSTNAYNNNTHEFLSVWKDARNYTTSHSDVYGQRFSLGQPRFMLLDEEGNIYPSLIDFGAPQPGLKISKLVRIKSIGDSSLELCEISIPEAPYTLKRVDPLLNDGDSSTCISLPPASETNFDVVFEPETTGTFPSEFSIITTNGGNKKISLVGQGQASATGNVDVTPTSLDFGNITIDTEISKFLKIQNNGTSPVSVEFNELRDPFSIASGLSEGMIINKDGDSTWAEIRFSPEYVRDYQTTLTLYVYDTDDSTLLNTVTIAITGNGVEQSTGDPVTPIINISKQNIDFGEVEVASTQSYHIKISNDGNGTATLLHFDRPVPSEVFSVEGISDGNATIPSGDSINLIVSFTPEAAISYSSMGQLLFEHEEEPIQLLFQGQGVDGLTPPNISFSTNSISFGSVRKDSSKAYNLRLTNSGGTTSEILDIGVDDPSFSVESEATSIKRGETINIVVKFLPEDTNTHEAQLRILFDHLSAPVTVSLSGTGYESTLTPASVTCEQTEIDFGNIDIGRTRYVKINCSNSGQEDATVIDISSYGDRKEVFETAPHSECKTGEIIPGGDSKSLWISFLPEANRSYEAQFEMLFDYSDNPITFNVAGRGVPEGSGEPSLQYYLYSDVLDSFMSFTGQGQLFIVELMGEDLVTDRVFTPGSPFTFETIFEQQAFSGFPGYPDRDGHYIYSISLNQQNLKKSARSQFMVMDVNYNDLFNSIFMGTYITPTNWGEGNLPELDIVLVDVQDNSQAKAVFLPIDEISSRMLEMNLAIKWEYMPTNVKYGDFYLLMTNHDTTKIYCYDIESSSFNSCSPVIPTVEGTVPTIDASNIILPFKMPEDTNGLWRIFLGLITSDGTVFYDQVAIVAGQTTGGEIIEIF